PPSQPRPPPRRLLPLAPRGVGERQRAPPLEERSPGGVDLDGVLPAGHRDEEARAAIGEGDLLRPGDGGREQQGKESDEPRHQRSPKAGRDGADRGRPLSRNAAPDGLTVRPSDRATASRTWVTGSSSNAPVQRSPSRADESRRSSTSYQRSIWSRTSCSGVSWKTSPPSVQPT